MASFNPGTLHTFGGGFFVSLSGAAAFRAALNGWREGARVIGGARATFGSPVPYAYGINYGHTRGGRLARKAGGVHFIEISTEAGSAYLAQALPAFFAHPQLGGAGRILAEFYSKLETTAKATVPVVSGRLQSSIRVKPSSGVFGSR